MIEKLPNYGDMQLLVDRINEMIDAINRMENHFHHARELQFGTEFPTYGKASQITPNEPA